MTKFYPLTVKEVKKETNNSVSVLFDVPDQLKSDFQFKAGQYITIRKVIAGEELRRAYSICSSPKSGELRIAIKAIDNGNFSVFATTILNKGDVLEVSEPEGNFLVETFHQNKKNYLAIAAGSGITPIISMLKAITETELNSSFTLIYGNKTIEETIFKDEIDRIMAKNSSRVSVFYAFSKQTVEGSFFGRINSSLIKSVFNKQTFNHVFICGPTNLISDSKKTILELGFNEDLIKVEYFSSPEEPNKTSIETDFEGESKVTVILDEEEITVKVHSKETLLSSFLKQDIDAPYSCKGGVCSSCIAKVIEGKAKMERNYMLSKEEVDSGFVLTCQARPASKKLKIDFDEI